MTTALYGLLSLKIIRRPAANIPSGRKQTLTWWISSYFVYQCWVTDSKGWHNCCTHRAPSVNRYFCTPSSAQVQTSTTAAGMSCTHTLGKLLILPHLLLVTRTADNSVFGSTNPVKGWYLTWENPLCVGLYLKGTYYTLEGQEK